MAGLLTHEAWLFGVQRLPPHPRFLLNRHSNLNLWVLLDVGNMLDEALKPVLLSLFDWAIAGICRRIIWPNFLAQVVSVSRLEKRSANRVHILHHGCFEAFLDHRSKDAFKFGNSEWLLFLILLSLSCVILLLKSVSIGDLLHLLLLELRLLPELLYSCL